MKDRPLRKFVIPEIVYGVGAIDLVGQYARIYGARNVLVVTDPGVIAAGWAARVAASLDAAGIRHETFSSVSPNPRAEEVMAGAAFYRASACDVLVAVGGGSPMDCAKGIGIVGTSGRHILEFEGVDQVSTPMPPLVCVPTTAGTSADVSQFAIVTDRQARVKVAIISKAVVPDTAILDPEALTTMDPYLAACTGMDALVHAIEAYVSNANSPLTDLQALDAVRLVGENLLGSIRVPGSLAYREKMMLGSLEAGFAFSNASLGAVHAMAHSLGGLLDLPHGECNALLLEHVVRFNFESAEARYRNVAAALGIGEAQAADAEACRSALCGRIRDLRISAGIKGALAERGVSAGDIPDLAANAMRDACMVTNPRVPGQRDIEEIYEEAI
jgi:alcohol dehydrogenase class IV